jgi:serine/threonine protein kinase
MAERVVCNVSRTNLVSNVVSEHEKTNGPSSHTSCGFDVAPGVTIGPHGPRVVATQSSSNTNDLTIMSNVEKLKADVLNADHIQDCKEIIGSGGNCSVYGMQRGDGRRFAVKLVRNYNRDSGLKVMKEARVLLSLLHVQSMFLCMPEGMYYLHHVMYFVFPRFNTSVHALIEYCSSKTDNIYSETFPDLVYNIIQSAVRGLAAIHEVGFAHCDVKTKNVLLCEKCEGGVACALADFGQSMKVRTSGVNDPSDPLFLDTRSQDIRMLFVNDPNKDLKEDMHALWMMFDDMVAKLRIQKTPQSANAMSHTYRGFNIVDLLFTIRDNSTHADFEKIKSAVDVVQQMSQDVRDVHWNDRLRGFV